MRAPRFCHAFAALIASLLAAQAQLPSAKLTWVFPPGAAVGSTNEITVAGSDLDAPTTLVFSHPSITAVPRPDGSPVFTVVVPGDVAPGLFEVRFAGRFGVSNPRGFQVGTDPEHTIAPTNTSPAAAFEIVVNSVVNGRVQPANTYWYRFEARQGQRLIAQVQARDLDSRLVPDLALLTANQRELRVVRRNALLHFTVPEDGSYFLRLNDQTYRGGDDYVYRLVLSDRPHVEFALPFTWTDRTAPRARLFGQNLPKGEPAPVLDASGQALEMLDSSLSRSVQSMLVQLPVGGLSLRKPAAAVLTENFLAHPHAWPLFPSLHTFIQTPYPSSWGVSNGLATVTPPCDFSGLFPKRGEVSGVTFESTKGSLYWIEVFSDRLGFNTDPLLVIQRLTRNDKGEEKIRDLQELSDIDSNSGGREFDTTSRDAVGRFQVPEDGTYRILARDLYRGGPQSPRLPYRLQIRPETPDYRLAVFPQPPPRRDDNDRQIHLMSLALRRGATLPLRVIAFRRDGFDGPIEVTANSLPTGVVASPARIASGQSATTLLLTAATNAPASLGSVEVSGRARIADQDVDRKAVASTARWHIPDWDQERGNPRFTATLALGVVGAEMVPIALDPADTKPIEIPAKGKLRIPLTIARAGEFQGAFKLKPFGHPTLDKAKETDVPEKATNVVVEVDLGEAQLPEGEHIVHLEGTVSGKYRNNPEATDETAKPTDVTLRVYSPPVVVRVTPPPKAG
jgi:hypothetical protein